MRLTRSRGGRKIFRVNLAVDELVTNYVLHSMHKVRQPRMELTLRIRKGKLIVTLLDTGPPFDPRDAPEPDLSDDLDERQAGGLGLHLVRSYCDRMHHEIVDSYNRLTLTRFAAGMNAQSATGGSTAAGLCGGVPTRRAVGAPEKALDNLAAAASGRPTPHATFLPVSAADCDELGAAERGRAKRAEDS